MEEINDFRTYPIVDYSTIIIRWTIHQLLLDENVKEIFLTSTVMKNISVDTSTLKMKVENLKQSECLAVSVNSNFCYLNEIFENEGTVKGTIIFKNTNEFSPSLCFIKPVYFAIEVEHTKLKNWNKIAYSSIENIEGYEKNILLGRIRKFNIFWNELFSQIKKDVRVIC